MYQQTPPADLLALAPPDVSKTLHTWFVFCSWRLCVMELADASVLTRLWARALQAGAVHLSVWLDVYPPTKRCCSQGLRRTVCSRGGMTTCRCVIYMHVWLCAHSLGVASHDSGTHEPTAVVATRRLRWSEHGLCTKLLLAVAWVLALAMILFWVWVWVEPLMRHGRVV